MSVSRSHQRKNIVKEKSMIALEALKGRLVDGLLEVQKEEGYVARERFIFNR